MGHEPKLRAWRKQGMLNINVEHQCVVIVYTHQVGHDESTRESVGIYPTQLLHFLGFYNTKAYLFVNKEKLIKCIFENMKKT